jgi:hypothetical protein
VRSCSKCAEGKPIDQFGRDARQPDGVHRQCKACVNAKLAAHRAANAARRREISAKYREANREKVREACRQWYQRDAEAARAKKRAYDAANPEQSKQRRKQWRDTNPLRYAIHQQRVRHATPPWADKVAIRAVYAEARRLTRATGIPHEVDHELPLRGREVCGLHVERNLRVVPSVVNRSKSNRMPL